MGMPDPWTTRRYVNSGEHAAAAISSGLARCAALKRARPVQRVISPQYCGYREYLKSPDVMNLPCTCTELIQA